MKKFMTVLTLLVMMGGIDAFAQLRRLGPVVVDTSSIRGYNTGTRGAQRAIAVDATTGNVVIGWYALDSADPNPRIIEAAVSTDAGVTWTKTSGINAGVNPTFILDGTQPSVEATAQSPIIVYTEQNAGTAGSFATDIPVFSNDVLGWGGGLYQNVKIDEVGTASLTVNMEYISVAVNPSNASHVGVTAFKDDDAGDAPEMIIYYNSVDGGNTWGNPFMVAAEDTGAGARRVGDISTSSSRALLGPGGTGFLEFVGREAAGTGLWRLWFALTTDGGATWSNPMLIPEADTLNLSNGLTVRNKLPFRDGAGNWHIFAVCTTQVDNVVQVFDVRRNASGLWSINRVVRSSVIDRGIVLGGGSSNAMAQPTLGNDGRIYLSYTEVWDTTGGVNAMDYFVVSSADNGDTWSQPVQLTNSRVLKRDSGVAERTSVIAGKEWLHYVWVDERAFGSDTVDAVLYTRIEADSLLVSVPQPRFVPESFSLSQNYPNPFNPQTSINFSLKEKGFVSLEIFSVLGQKVATLVNEQLPAGEYGLSWNAFTQASGVYFYQLTVRPEQSAEAMFTEVRKMTLLR